MLARSRRLAPAALSFALLPALAVGQDGVGQDGEPPLPELPQRPADPGGMNMEQGDEPAPKPLVSEEPLSDRAVPLPRPLAGPAGASNAALRSQFGMAGGTCLPFGPPPACGVGPADRCVGLPYAGFLYYGTPACDDDCLNHTWTTDTAGQGEPGAAKVARHARRHEAAPRSRRSWLPWRH
ncbi:hypothetical protein [Alienimonas californiensis]|uniref:Uncharacterized protein n=1 Tax=Alienimonas californiensis TaxID=2527989 RepID=A0A517PB48_9PLAN|nr:hypothetical protein [Alienimonas californiensis]QDT16594.1 hypothetical protein CA12_27000 [Alienimonas californiensis]